MKGNYTTPPYDFGDLMTVQEWLDNVKDGLFIDYDGNGHAIKNGLMDLRNIWPSEADQVPYDATHILWFNK